MLKVHFCTFGGTIPRRSRVFPMCDKCDDCDKRIEHYGRMLLSIGDQVTVDRIKELIAALQAQKVVLHPEQKQ